MKPIENSHKIFDEYEVECNDCQRYWLDQCDGAKVNTTKSCTSFLATKNTDIPHKLSKLDDKVKSLGTAVTILEIIMLFHLLSHIIEVFTL